MTPGKGHAHRLLHWLLKAYPPTFRARFGAGMLYSLEARAAEADRIGIVARTGFWLRTIAGCLALGLLERIRSLPGPTETLATLVQEARVATRRLRRTPGFAATAVLTLALGLGATTAIHAVVDGVLIEPLPYPESERLVWVGHSALGADIPRLGASYGSFLLYRDLAESIEAATIYDGTHVTLLGSEGPSRIEAGRVTHEFFDLLLDGPPTLGRWIAPSDDTPGAPRVTVISHDLWQSRYGADRDVVGTVVTLDDEPVEIVGVLPPGFRFLERAPDILLALRLDESEVVLGAFGRTMVARAKLGMTPDQIRRDLASLLPRARERFNPHAYEMLVEDGRLQPIVEPAKEALVGSMERTLWLLLGTVAFVLLIACANVANLWLVRAEGRRREGWIRSALGAGRWPVVRMFLCESLLLTVTGGLLGLALATFGVPLLVRFGPAELPRLESVGLDGGVAATALALAGIAGLVFGLLAGLRREPGQLAASIHDGGRGTTGGRRSGRLRRGLVVAQVALALILLIGSALMLQSFWQLGRVDPGFEPEEALGFRVALSEIDYPTRLEAARFQQRLAERLSDLPGVVAAGGTGCLPLTDCGAINVAYADDQPVEDGRLPDAVWVLAASGGAFEALGIPLLEGRSFGDGDIGGPPVAVVSRGLAERLWPVGSAVGQRIHPDLPDDSEPPYTVIGVVGDHYSARLTDGPTENLYLSLGGSYAYMANPRHLSFAIRTDGPPGRFVGAVREVVRELDATVPVVDVQPLTELAAADRASTAFAMLLLAIAGSIALTLGMVGVYGVLAYMVSTRTGEIGVRLALGASAGDVRRMVTREGLALVAVGVLVGSAGALALSRTIAAVLFGVRATDPLTYLSVALLLSVVAFAASWLPAYRAARVDPVEALRAEA